MKFRDRIVGLEKIPASELADNPKNWRTHSPEQLRVLEALLQEVGFAGAELTYRDDAGRLVLVDGHARKRLAQDELVPCLITDLTAEEADKILATYDPLGAMAGKDQDKLDALLRDMEFGSEAVNKILGDLAGKNAEGLPDGKSLDLTPQYAVMVKCPDEATQRQLLTQADASGFEASAVCTGLPPIRKLESMPPPAPGVTRISRTTRIHRSPRVRQVEGMFDLPEQGEQTRTWDFQLELPKEWSIGLIVGPSGSGKSTLARDWFGDKLIESWPWPDGKAVVDGFPDGFSVQEVTGLLSAVGFSSPPGWIKPYSVLSNGEKFRVDVARTLAEMPDLAVIDEFTSVVDRTVAKIGSATVAKAVRTTGRRLVAVTCHYDVAEWLQPDWMLDVQTGTLTRGLLRRRPPLDVSVRRTGWESWGVFREHHYLNHDLAKSARCYQATVAGKPAAFVAVISQPHHTRPYWRCSRVVTLPDYQGVGIGNKVLATVAAAYTATGKPFSIVTSHPGLTAHLARSANWRCTRPFSTMGPHCGTDQAGGPTSGLRSTCTFVWQAPGDPAACRALGLTPRP